MLIVTCSNFLINIFLLFAQSLMVFLVAFSLEDIYSIFIEIQKFFKHFSKNYFLDKIWVITNNKFRGFRHATKPYPINFHLETFLNHFTTKDPVRVLKIVVLFNRFSLQLLQFFYTTGLRQRCAS